MPMTQVLRMAYVAYNSNNIKDAAGNNNGLVDFGEDITLDMTLENLGSLPAYNVNATLICNDSYLIIRSKRGCPKYIGEWQPPALNGFPQYPKIIILIGERDGYPSFQ